MKAKLSPLVQKKIKEIFLHDRKLYKRIEKQIKLFEANPKHPSLRIHKLSGKPNHMWSLSVNRSLRMIYQYVEKDIVYFVDLGTHDEVYKK
ncbi:MAG TPA: type II toxin-antitoxin system mRNA interferase toxin, RelE/StbE family [Candidatus Levybacteria bacterium]|nr:type II toxin-antitoxin system mRNA interferase toxin, RelE/StbE family [Candidatus Levybacteria bacterium]